MRRTLLILDIDETLIHAAERPIGRAADFQVGAYHVYRRPFLAEFIDAVAAWYDLAVWSSASEAYVAGIVEQVFGPTHPLRFVWARQRCTRRYHPELQEHYYAKNLSKLRRHGHALERILMLDDTPEKVAQHYGNHIRIPPFTGDPADRQLPALLPFLDALRTAENVRRIEKRYWQQHRPPGGQTT